MDKAALYLRLSKEDVDKINKGDDSESIVNQRLLLTDYAISHDFQIADIYSDDDYSGLYDDRPEFDRLIRDAKLGKFNIVIAKTQSRFTRNMEHMEKYLHHDFPLLGIRFIGVTDNADTNNVGNKKARQINGLVNEWYCEDLSNNIRAVFHQKMKAGQYLGGFAPYGYLKDPEDKYKFIIDEYAANIVRKIYSLYLSGYSLKGICSYLEDEKVPNPTVYKAQQGLNYKNVKSNEFSIKYGLWSTTTIKRILSNNTYIGTLTQGTVQKASYKDKKIIPVPEEQWYVTKNHHEAIINEDTFFKVAKIRANRRVCRDNQSGDKKVHIFAGKIKCADCGHSIIKIGNVRGNKNDSHMKCQLANKSRSRECSPHNVKFSAVQDNVHRRIKEIVDTVLENKEYSELLNQITSEESEKKGLRKEKMILNDIATKIDDISKSTKTLYLDRVKGNISEEMFFRIKNDFESELTKLTEKKKAVLAKIENLEHDMYSKKNAFDIVKKYADYSTLTHEIINDFIDYIEIEERNKETKEQGIIIHWNF